MMERNDGKREEEELIHGYIITREIKNCIEKLKIASYDFSLCGSSA